MKCAYVFHQGLVLELETVTRLMVDWDRSKFLPKEQVREKQAWWPVKYLSALFPEGSSLPIPSPLWSLLLQIIIVDPSLFLLPSFLLCSTPLGAHTEK